MHAALPKQPINQFKLIQQSRQQTLRAYCPDIYTVTTGCQENYPDEYCSQYPPEGIPAKPRSIADWGTNFNITSNMMKKGKYLTF